MLKFVCFFLLVLTIIPVMGFPQEIDFGIPQRPDYSLPPGYEWYLQQKEDGSLVWVPKKEEVKESYTQPPRPKDELPKGWDWFPVYSGDILVAWKAQLVPSWFDRNRTTVEYIGGFILSIMNVFSFMLGKKSGSVKK